MDGKGKRFAVKTTKAVTKPLSVPLPFPVNVIVAGYGVCQAINCDQLLANTAQTLTNAVSNVIEWCKKPDCPPCSPPAGKKFNKVTHWTSHSPDPNKGTHGCQQKTGSPVHWHYSVNHQNPLTCQCNLQQHAFGGCGQAPSP